jgi:hypothetical protein
MLPMGRNKKDAGAVVNGSNGADIEPHGSEAAYQRFVEAARGLDRRDLVRMRGDASLAYRNAQRALEMLTQRQATIDGELPRLPVRELVQVPEIAQAVIYAEDEVERAERNADELEKLMSRARKLRKRLLRWADDLLTGDGGSALAQVRRGDSAADTAEDCVALARLLAPHVEADGGRKNKKKKGKKRLSAKKLAEAAEIGAELARRLRPGDRPGNGGATPDVREAVEMRDRLWTLLNERYIDLWRAGAYLFGPEVDDRLPSLQSRRAARKGVAKA